MMCVCCVFCCFLSVRWKWRRDEDGERTRRGVQPRINRVELRWMEQQTYTHRNDGDGDEIIRSQERKHLSASGNQIWMKGGGCV